LNLFYPAGARFSLRNDNSSGAEVFSVTGTGAVTLTGPATFGGPATFSGPIIPKVGNSASAGIQFPSNPGGGGGDEAFLRYYVTAGETTKLVLGINNDPDDTLGLWQAGGERLTISGGQVGIGTTNPNHAFHVVAPNAVGLFESSGSEAF